MPREIKSLLFSLICLIFGGSFLIQWVSTGSIIQGLIMVGQLILLMLTAILGFIFFMALGMSIFK